MAINIVSEKQVSLLFNFIKQLCIKSFKLINYIRLFILNLLFLIIVISTFVLLSNDKDDIQIVENSYLNIELNGFLVEQKRPVSLSEQLSKALSGESEFEQEFEVQTLISTIKHAQKDPKITGIILSLTGLKSGSLDQLSDIGDAITHFKSANKEVIAYAANYSQTQYYLAAYADKVILPPNGAVFLQGFAVNRLYFKALLDNLLITPHIFKVGTYKSFVEPFTNTSMSDESKQANRHWLDQLWQHYITHVLAQRADRENLSIHSINPSLIELKKAFKKVSGDTAKYALSTGLVDQLTYYDSLLTTLNINSTKNKQQRHLVNYQSYSSTLPSLYSVTGAENQIAVIHASGEIVAGHSDKQAIADQDFNQLLDIALKRPRIKAVVLRLDTPGGSAFASENIRQKVIALKNAGKKVVVSMGSVTASGGYWIASTADKIVASPTTLTGSIGIFGMFATIDKTLNRIGIHQDGVSTNELANIGLTQPLNPALADIFQIGIEGGYQHFLNVVAEGREMAVEDVDKIAQGRVWTGIDALKNGLIDDLGNLDSAIHLAAELALLDDYDTVIIKPQLSSKQVFINDLFSQTLSLLPKTLIQPSSFMSILTNIESQADFMTRLNDPQNRFVYCLVCNLQ